jgi:hypothetical protein
MEAGGFSTVSKPCGPSALSIVWSTPDSYGLRSLEPNVAQALLEIENSAKKSHVTHFGCL